MTRFTLPTVPTIDACQAVLQEYGWSAGDVAYRLNNAIVWQVYAHREDERIVVRADSQVTAWTAAANQAGKLWLSLR